MKGGDRKEEGAHKGRGAIEQPRAHPVDCPDRQYARCGAQPARDPIERSGMARRLSQKRDLVWKPSDETSDVEIDRVSESDDVQEQRRPVEEAGIPLPPEQPKPDREDRLFVR